MVVTGPGPLTSDSTLDYYRCSNTRAVTPPHSVNMRSDQLLQLSHELLLRPSLSSSPCEYEIWSLCHVSWLGGRPRKKMLIVPKMQSLCRLCEFIKNLYGIKFVVYEEAVRWTIEWNFVWKEFFMETKYLPIISTVITLLLGLRLRPHKRTNNAEEDLREAATSIPPCHDFLVTINFLPRRRDFSHLFCRRIVNNSPSHSNVQFVARNNNLDHKIMQLWCDFLGGGNKTCKKCSKPQNMADLPFEWVQAI